MIQRYRSISRLGKVFTWLSVTLVIAFVIAYFLEVRDALTMDPRSYECTSDSMMMQICHDPYSSSVAWAVIKVVILGWPFLLTWLVVGVVLFIRLKQPSKTDKVFSKNQK